MTHPLTYSEYKEGLAKGVLLGLRCNACREHILPPTAACPTCGSSRLEVASFSPRGRITTFTVVRVAAAGFLPPFVVAMVELDQGPWVMGTVKGIQPEAATMDLIGRNVHVGSDRTAADPYSGGEGVSLTFELEGQ